MKYTGNNKGNERMAKVVWCPSAPRGIEITILQPVTVGYINP